MVYIAVMVGKSVQRDLREWYPSTTGPLLPTRTSSLLAVPSNLSVPPPPPPCPSTALSGAVSADNLWRRLRRRIHDNECEGVGLSVGM